MRSYQVKIFQVIAGSSVCPVTDNGETKAEVVTDQWVSIYDLEPSSSYTISVCAETSAGCSEKTVVNKTTLRLAG
jgi:hypothetical protein